MFSAEVKTGLLRHLPQAMLLDIIAATEGSMGMSIATTDSPVDTASFQPAPGVIVITAERRRIEPGSGQSGLVALPGGSDGYYKDEAKTVAAVISRTAVAPEPAESILTAARTGLASYKVPRTIVVVDEVPRTQVGKADHPAARGLFDAGLPEPVEP